MPSKTPDIWLFGLGIIFLAYGLLSPSALFIMAGIALLGIGALSKLMMEKRDEKTICSALRLIGYPISVVYVYVLNELANAFIARIPVWLTTSYYLVYFVILFGADRVYSREENREAVAVAMWKSFRLAAALLAIFVAASAAMVNLKLF